MSLAARWAAQALKPDGRQKEKGPCDLGVVDRKLK